MEALFQEIEEYQVEKEQQQEEKVEPQPSKKRIRSEGTSQQGPQAFDSEPLFRKMFDRMSLIESNFNTRMDTMESNFNVRFTQMNENIAHLQHVVHHIYEQQGYSCTFSSFVPPPPPSPPPN